MLTVPPGFDIGVWTAHWPSESESLGFVVRMPVILLLACFSLSSIYRAVFTPGVGGFRGGNSDFQPWPETAASESTNATLWAEVIPKTVE